MELSPDCQRGAVGRVKGAKHIPLKKKKKNNCMRLKTAFLACYCMLVHLIISAPVYPIDFRWSVRSMGEAVPLAGF